MKGPWREIHSDGTAHFMNPAFQRIERLHEQRWEFIHGHLVFHDAPQESYTSHGSHKG